MIHVKIFYFIVMCNCVVTTQTRDSRAKVTVNTRPVRHVALCLALQTAANVPPVTCIASDSSENA